LKTPRYRLYAPVVSNGSTLRSAALTVGGAALLTGGIAVGLVGYRFLTIDDQSPWWEATPSVAIAWTYLVAGLIAWWRRPASRIGPLLLLVAAALLVRKLQYADEPALFTIGFALGGVYAACFVHVVLAYPSGRIRDRVERWFVAVTYSISLLLPVSVLLVYDPARGCLFNCSDLDRARPHSLISISGDHTTFTVVHDVQHVGGYGIAGAAFVALIVRRYRSSSPHMRRRLTPLLVAGVAAGMRAVSEAVFGVISRSDLEGLVLFSIEEAVQIAVPIVLLLGILGERLARASVADLVRELQATPPTDVAKPVARALHDPTLEVAFWMPARSGYVDADGRPYELPEPGLGRSITRLARGGEPVAVLVHDPALLEEPKLLDGVGAAALMSLENARLHAELQAQLLKVQESRARIVAAGDVERGRIERDLHDGAQQRLVALALDLRLAERRADPETRALLASAVDSLQTAVGELRELAHGVYPAALMQAGLGAALDELAARTALRVTVRAPSQRLPEAVEATAYFVACEGLANAVKHSHAAEVRIEAAVQGSMLTISVADDGSGGADSRGAGLRGLSDRVEARGGRFWVDSPPNGGTHLRAEIPCGS
jgi:signal transduction histidine kinase